MRRRSASDVRRRKRTLLLLGFGLVLLLFMAFMAHLKNPAVAVAKSDESSSREGEASSSHAELLDVHSIARQLSDQMVLAKALNVIAKDNNNLALAWRFSEQIKASQQLFSQAATSGRGLLAEEAEPVMREMASLILQARELHYDIATAMMKYKAQALSLEERAAAAAVQSTTFGQLAAEAVPKSLNCLSMLLTTEWASNRTKYEAAPTPLTAAKLTDNSLHHVVIFSDNVLGTSVVINSTVTNAAEPERFVFHLVTDTVSYGAMRVWFAPDEHRFRGATVEVQDIASFTWLNASYVPVLRQLQDAETQSYYFKSGAAAQQQQQQQSQSQSQAQAQAQSTAVKFRNPKYLSMLNHLRFYIPEIYPQLRRVVFLDDDVVVQRDLALLFAVDLAGNVNGAVETCLESFHRYHKYLNFTDPRISGSFDPDSCGWAFGMNVFDLVAWRAAGVTARYHHWQEQNVDRSLWKLGTLPPGLLTFYGLTQPLDRRLHVLGLGYDPNVDPALIDAATVIHFNGNMKPWLKLAMARYRPLWERYVDYAHPYAQRCNIH